MTIKMGLKRKGAETRQLIFDAASQLLIETGLSSLTLEKVAEKAGLSKGGLLYHFPTKVALVEGLFNHHNSIFEARLNELYEASKSEPGAWLRAYAIASLEQSADRKIASLYASLFAAEERYASAHQLMRQKYADWQARIDQCRLDPETSSFVRMAVDGLWFAEVHNYAPPDPQRRERLIELIMAMTHGSHRLT